METKKAYAHDEPFKTEQQYIIDLDDARVIADAESENREKAAHLKAALRAARMLDQSFYSGSDEAYRLAAYSHQQQLKDVPSNRSLVDTRTPSEMIANGMDLSITNGNVLSEEFFNGVINAMELSTHVNNPWERQVGRTALKHASENTLSQLYDMAQNAEFSAIYQGQDAQRKLNKDKQILNESEQTGRLAPNLY